MTETVQLETAQLEAVQAEKKEYKGAVLICPGGGYCWLSPREGLPVAKAFEAAGWKPWILKYSIYQGEKLGKRPLIEAGMAVKEIRKLMPGKPVVVCGFSAGGHVAASIGVHWNDREVFTEEETLVRPDGLILCYPVISSGIYAHKGSMDCLADPEGQEYFSLEKWVDSQTPPAFLWHTAGDRTVSVENTLLFAQALDFKKVPFEVHIYPRGEHGLSLATKEVAQPEKNRRPDAHVAGWFEQCIQWLDVSFNENRTAAGVSK